MKTYDNHGRLVSEINTCLTPDGKTITTSSEPNSLHGTTCSISSRNAARRVFLLYRSNPVVIASVRCLIAFRGSQLNLHNDAVESRENLIRVSLGIVPCALSGGDRQRRSHHLTNRHIVTSTLVFCGVSAQTRVCRLRGGGG
jgi:hypothetical protein